MAKLRLVICCPDISCGCRNCGSAGNYSLAACGLPVSDTKEEGREAYIARVASDPVLLFPLIGKGLLMNFPGDPAARSTPCAQQCSKLSTQP